MKISPQSSQQAQLFALNHPHALYAAICLGK